MTIDKYDNSIHICNKNVIKRGPLPVFKLKIHISQLFRYYNDIVYNYTYYIKQSLYQTNF